MVQHLIVIKTMANLPEMTPAQIEELVLQSLADNLEGDIDLGQDEDTVEELQEEAQTSDRKPKTIKRNPKRY